MTDVPCASAGARPQKILVFQQNGSGESKIEGIRRFGGDSFLLEVVSIDEALPPIIDDADEYLPKELDADLVLDYLTHPDLSMELGMICSRLNIPLVARGKKHRIKGVHTPITCCALSERLQLGCYGERFGAPEFTIRVADGKIAGISVLRGAPCGATWDAAARVVGMTIEEAPIRLGLETQFFCTANPAGWDPIYGKSPVHFAADLHLAAFEKALEQAVKNEEGSADGRSG